MEAPLALRKAQRIANTLDTAVKIPFIGVRVGLDFLIGLIPVVGDITMLLASLRIVSLGKQLGLPSTHQQRMLRHCLVDFGLGFVPVVGDVVDLFYKANQKNVRIMERWWIETHQSEVQENTQAALAAWQSEFDNTHTNTKTNN